MNTNRKWKVNHGDCGLPAHLTMSDAEMAWMEKHGWFYHDGEWKLLGPDYQVCATRGDL